MSDDDLADVLRELDERLARLEKLIEQIALGLGIQP